MLEVIAPGATQTSTGRIPANVERLVQYEQNFHLWARECMWTIDQADKIEPVKPWPQDKDVYLEYVLDRIIEEPLVAVVKTRRLFLTWGCLGVVTWDCLFKFGRYMAVLSKKEDESDVLVRKIKFIVEHIPEEKMPVRPLIEYSYNKLRFPETDSLIQGFAQGDDQLRQHTCSRIFGDEFAFWQRARASWVAMKPTIEGGGQVALVSTRYPGFYQNLIYDTMDFK